MVRAIAYVLLLMGLGKLVLAQDAGKAAPVPTNPVMAKQQAERAQLEIYKLRLDMDAVKRQLGWMESIKGWIAPHATLIAGLGLIWKFVLGQEAYSHIEFTADINVIGEQEGRKIVELIAYVENKGNAKHQMNTITFDLNGILAGEIPQGSERWRGETDFRHPLGTGSFLPASFEFFFVDPSVKAKYSQIRDVPTQMTFLMLHCHFEYPPRPLSYLFRCPKVLGHTAEKTICLIPAAETAAATDTKAITA